LSFDDQEAGIRRRERADSTTSTGSTSSKKKGKGVMMKKRPMLSFADEMEEGEKVKYKRIEEVTHQRLKDEAEAAVVARAHEARSNVRRERTDSKGSLQG